LDEKGELETNESNSQSARQDFERGPDLSSVSGTGDQKKKLANKILPGKLGAKYVFGETLCSSIV